jgi:hypothetical protein
MESRTFCVYNETSKCFLSTRVAVVDAAMEPLRVLRVLMEGLTPDTGGGLWLIHFKGVPVARALSPFDLIYLDKDFRVVHGIELSVDTDFEPFKGQPSSALILPSKTITAAKTRTGNQLNFREVFDPAPSATVPQGLPQAMPARAAPAAIEPGESGAAGPPLVLPDLPSAVQPSAPMASGRLTTSAPVPQPGRSAVERPPIANIPSRVVPASVAKSINVPPEFGPSGRAAAGGHSGRLLRAAPARPEMSAVPQPVVPDLPDKRPVHQDVQPTHGTLIPFPAAPADSPVAEGTQPSLTLPELPTPPFKWDELQAPPSIESLPDLGELAASVSEVQVRNQRIDEALAPASKAARRLPWDVRLLYWVFPEFDPTQETEFRIPRADFLNEARSRNIEPSTRLKFLSWLYPDLHLERVEKTRRESRAAPRLPDPGLVAYFFTGGSPRPHEVKNISVTGFYMFTDERWLPGTIIRVTLQIVGTTGEHPSDTITVHSRVVRWGIDGGGFEFVLPGFLDE